MQTARKRKHPWKTFFSFSVRDTVYCVLIILAFSALTHFLKVYHLDNQMYTVMIFFLGVVLLSGLTDGYFYGIFSAVIFMLETNIFFTEPYMVLDF